jgi:RNA polymerase sigma-70 factor (ECF subfamily)
LASAETTASPHDEAALIDQCRRGDSAAFGDLVRKYQDRVFNTCWRLCGNRTDAEDLTQEAFVRAFQSIDRFAGRSRFYTWVYRIAVNLTISARRKDRRARWPSLDAEQSGTDGEASRGDQLDSGEASPAEKACDREQEARVMAALSSLEDEPRAVVILRDLESLGYDEIAEILDIPAGTVKSRLHRARLALRAKLTVIRNAS